MLYAGLSVSVSLSLSLLHSIGFKHVRSGACIKHGLLLLVLDSTFPVPFMSNQQLR